jgi:hypothetical protein
MDNDPTAAIAVPHEYADPGLRYVALAGVALLVTLPVAAWWVVGDLSFRGSDDLDYFVRPPAVSPALERFAGVGALAVALVATAALAVATGRRRLHPRWWLAVPPLIGAGLLTGIFGRVMSAGGIGVNFGAIFALVLGVPVVLSLVLTSVLAAVVLRGRSRRRQAGLPAAAAGTLTPAAAVYGANLAAVPTLLFAYSAVAFYAFPVLAVALVALAVWARRRNAARPPGERRQALTAAACGALACALLILGTVGVGVLAVPVVTLVTTLVVGARARRLDRGEETLSLR